MELTEAYIMSVFYRNPKIDGILFRDKIISDYEKEKLLKKGFRFPESNLGLIVKKPK